MGGWGVSCFGANYVTHPEWRWRIGASTRTISFSSLDEPTWPRMEESELAIVYGGKPEEAQ